MQRKFASKSGFFDLRVPTALFVVSAGAAAVALFAPAIPSGLAVETALPEEGPTPTPAPRTILYDQYDNFATVEPVNIRAQDAETRLDVFDSQAADDFIVPGDQTWQVTEVDVLGEYDSTGPATSFHVFFYENGAGDLPGILVASRLESPYTGSNDFVITLTEPVTLPEGHYWSRSRRGRILLHRVFGCGTIGRSNLTQALPGKTQATVSAPAASSGFARLPVLR
jgi:hypothetical protein